MDIYIKLSNLKFVKIFSKGQVYTREEVESWTAKHLSFFYYSKSQCAHAQSNEDYIDSGELLKTDFNKCDKDEAKRLLEETHKTISHLTRRFGIDDTVVALTDKYVGGVKNYLKYEKGLQKLFAKQKSRSGYLYDHSLLVSYLCSSLCSRMDWNSPKSVEKICAAALFHDITLTNHELAFLSDCGQLTEERKKDFSHEDLKRYKNHSNDGCQLITNAKNFPITDVANIIAGHHELPDGTGFPLGLGAQRVSPMVCLFNIVHHFINEIYKANFDFNLVPKILEKMKSKFEVGNYKKPFGCLENFIKRKCGTS